MQSGYTAVKSIANQRAEWLDVIRACYEQAGQTREFAGAWVRRRLGRWFPSLRILAQYDILEKVETSRGRKRAYYRMPDREGVGKAIQELGKEKR